MQLDKHVTLNHVESVEDVLVVEGDLHARTVYLGTDDLGRSTDICGVGGDGDVLTLGGELEPDGGVGLREDRDALDGSDERLRIRLNRNLMIGGNELLVIGVGSLDFSAHEDRLAEGDEDLVFGEPTETESLERAQTADFVEGLAGNDGGKSR